MQPDSSLQGIIAQALIEMRLIFTSGLFGGDLRAWHIPLATGPEMGNYVITVYVQRPYLVCTVPVSIGGNDPIQRRREAGEVLTLKITCVRLVPDGGLNEDTEHLAWLRSETVIGHSGASLTTEVVRAVLENMAGAAGLLLNDEKLQIRPAVPKTTQFIGPFQQPSVTSS